jgi:hypothetical protein
VFIIFLLFLGVGVTPVGNLKIQIQPLPKVFLSCQTAAGMVLWLPFPCVGGQHEESSISAFHLSGHGESDARSAPAFDNYVPKACVV